MGNPIGFFIRISAFISKELAMIFRQTRLLLALIIGPFLILLLFGLAFRDESQSLRTLYVIPEGQPELAGQVREYATTLGKGIDYRGSTSSETEALAALDRGRVDVVVVIPADVEGKIRASEHAVITLYHREIDPYQVANVEYIAKSYVDEVNRRVLKNIAEQGQEEAGSIESDLAAAKVSAKAMRIAFEQGNGATALNERNKLNRSLDAISLSVGASLGVLQGVETTTGSNQQSGDSSAAKQILETLDAINAGNDKLANTTAAQSSYSEEAKNAAEMEQNLDKLEGQLKDFRSIDSRVLVSPFRSELVNVNNLDLATSDFYAPGVIVLLLQHLLVTFAALSIVGERNSGTMELFRVAPISAFEMLLGKYLSYLVIGALLAVGISALVVLVLGVPMLGSWISFSIVLAALMFTALGIGFVISLVSQTNSQAVQYSMLVLLFSIFFSGFFLDLRIMWDYIRFVSWLTPATYGLRMLQDIMFRADPLNPWILGGLALYGLLFFALSWSLLHRQMKLS